MLDAATRRQSLNRRLQAIYSTLDDYEREPETLPDGTKALISSLKSYVAFTVGALEKRWDALEHARSKREETRADLVKDMNAAVQELTDTLLPVLSGSASKNTPVEMEALINRMVRQATDHGDETELRVIIYSDRQDNYRIDFRPRLLEKLVRSVAGNLDLGEYEPVDQVDFLFLRLPRLHRDNAPLHTVLLGHEMGHLLDWTEEISDGLKPPTPEEWLSEDGTEPKPTSEADNKAYVTFLQAWTSELVADILAAQALGPASLYAISDLALSGSAALSMDTATHPGTDRRLAVILRVLRGMGFLDPSGVDDPFSPDDLLRLESDPDLAGALERPIDTTVPGAQYAWTWLSDQIDNLIEECERAGGLSTHEPLRERWNEVDAAARQMAAGQPCGEVIEPDAAGGIEVRASGEDVICNAAWLVTRDRLSDLADLLGITTTNRLALAAQVLDGLVLKSMEISEIRRGRPWQPAS